MSRNAKLMAGLILLVIPTIQYGGYFLLRVLSGKMAALQLTEFQKSMFRAGHAHAGVLIQLSLICQIAADYAKLPIPLEWGVRVGLPLSALLISGGFFFSAMGSGALAPNGFITLIYVGAISLASSVITLGIGLLRNL